MVMSRLDTLTEIPHKARGFILDKVTGHPLPGVVVVAAAELDENYVWPFGMLVSDNSGYVSFDLNVLREWGTHSFLHLWVYPLSDETAKIDLTQGYRRGEVDIPFLLNVGCPPSAQSKNRIDLPSVQNPDVVDWRLSPYSFSTKSDMVLGEGGCETFLPSDVAERELRFYRVVRRLDQPTSINNTATITPIDPLKLMGGGEGSGQGAPTAIESGEVLEFRQQWFPLRHALGQVTYSLPLAPCESVDLAVIDWSRRDEAARTDVVTATENLLHEQRRDRDIEETIEAALSEKQGGFSLMGGLGASGTIPIGGAPISLGTALGAGISNSWGERDLEAKSQQDIQDRVRQATSVTRSLNSTVIVQGTQEEHNVLQTRTVTNHNHCHSLTVQYYEVLRNFRLVTAFVRKRPAVLIPYKLLDFDWEVALRHRTILEAVLLDGNLAPCFEAIVRMHKCQALYEKPADNGDGTSEGKQPTDTTIQRYDLMMQSGASPTAGQVSVDLQVKGEWKQLYFKEKVNDGGQEIPQDTDLFYTITSGDAIGVKRSDIERVRVQWFENDKSDDWWLDGIEITYKTADQPGLSRLLKEEGAPHLFYFNDAEEGTNAPAQWTSDPIPPAEEPLGEPGAGAADPAAPSYTKVHDECCEQRLLTHLKSNLGYYNRAIWLLQDETERRLLLDAALKNYPDIRNGLEEVPLAASGNYVAFPYNKPPESENGSLDEAFTMPKPTEDIVSLPTRGLFAEAQLSNCNSCERRDVTRFWNWAESPCEEPPAIEGIAPGPRGEAPSVQPGTLPAPVVQVMQPPAAPDPVGLAAVMSLLGQPNIFRDMSGMRELSQLLSGLSSGAIDLAQARELAKKVNEEVTNRGVQGSGVGGVGQFSPQSPSDRYDNLQVAREVAEAAPELGWDEETKGAVTTSIVGGGPFGTIRDLVLAACSLPRTASHASLAAAAERLGSESLTMKSYLEYQEKTWKWFFSPNPALNGAISKPASFSTWSDWRTLDWRQREVLANLASLDASALVENATNLTKLREAYKNWPSDRRAVFQSGGPGGEPTNTCNVFLGDALFLDGKPIMRDGRYYSAEQVYDGDGPFTIIPDKTSAARGDIVAWDYGHVEVVTSVDHGKDCFCSRGGYRSPIGGQKCGDGCGMPGDSARKISASNLRFVRVQS